MGAILCLVSAASFGAMAVFGKLAYDAGVTPDALLLVRFTLAAVLLAALLGGRRATRGHTPAGPDRAVLPPVRVLGTALLLGAVGYALQAGLYFAALRRMDASLLALVLYTYPALVTAAAVLGGRDRLTPARGTALVAASTGTLLVLLGTGGLDADPLGVALGFGAALTYTGYILVADGIVRDVSPVLLAALVMAGAAGTHGLRALAHGGVELGFGLAGWLWLLCIAGVSTVVATLTFFAGMRRVGPSNAAILSTFEPVVTAAAAALVLGESLGPVQVAGGVLVLASAALVHLRPAREPAAA